MAVISNKKAILLIGSPKQKASTSEALGSYLLNCLEEKGFITERMVIYRLIEDTTNHSVISALTQVDLIILSSPLYIDCLPYPVTRFFEILSKEWRPNEISRRTRFMSIVNCGFPEAFHNDTAIAICRKFAQNNKMEWVGGLSLGGGGAIDGRPLQLIRGLTRNVIKALKLAANELADDLPISNKAKSLMAKSLVPDWLYLIIGQIGWKYQAKKNGVQKALDARPYLHE